MCVCVCVCVCVCFVFFVEGGILEDFYLGALLVVLRARESKKSVSFQDRGPSR